MSTSLVRQLVFTFLYNDVEIKNLADVVLKLPSVLEGKSKIVVTPLRNYALSEYGVNQDIEHPEISITTYSNNNIDLTKHNGLHDVLIKKLKKVQLPDIKYNHELIREVREDFIKEINSYVSLQIYRFYLIQ